MNKNLYPNKNDELGGRIREQGKRSGRTQRTERHTERRTERDTTGQYQAILAAIADGVILTDACDTVILVNRAARQILNLGSSAPAENASNEATVVGQPVGTLFAAYSPEAQEELRQAIESISSGAQAAPPEALRSQEARVSVGRSESTRASSAPCTDLIEQETLHEPVRVVLSDQEHVIQASFTPTLDESACFAGTVIVLRDVTAEKQVAQAKNDFVSLVSHELRTPMTSIKGYTDLMLKGAVGKLSDQQRNFMSIVKSNVDRMAELVSDLLDVSRLEAGRVRLAREKLDLASVVYEISEELTETLRQRELTLEFDLAPGLPRVYADRIRVIQVLLNLLSNAYRYTPSGGTITISVRALDGEAQVDVADTGIGIPEQDQEAIFERFYRADHPIVRQQAGTGLGLPIAKSLIEMHGGRLWLCSEADKGSTFSFTLPLYTADEALLGQGTLRGARTDAPSESLAG